MANMTSQTDTSNQERSSQQEGSGFASKLAQTTNAATTQTVERLQQTRERLDKKLMDQRSGVVERARGLSRALNGAGTMLGDDDVGAHLLNYASDKIERAASYVEGMEPRTIAEDLRNLARERPAWFFGGAFTLGLALGRFAHSTASSAGGGEGATGEAADRQGRTSSARTSGQAVARRSPSGGSGSGMSSGGSGSGMLSGSGSGMSSAGTGSGMSSGGSGLSMSSGSTGISGGAGSASSQTPASPQPGSTRPGRGPGSGQP